MDEIVASGSLDGDLTLPVGVVLARIRKRLGLTGQQLGRRVGMSQAKISKIETGAVAPTTRDVQRLARALDLPADEARRLVDLTETSVNQLSDWRLRRGGLAAGQREIAQMEAKASVVRSFQPGILSGLLQTSEYARAVLALMQGDGSAEPGEPAPPVLEALSARVRRQEALANPGKRFVFVMPESVLLHLVGSPLDMPAQIDRLWQLSRQDNVTVRFVPQNQRWSYPPLHGFLILDDRWVIVDVLNTVLVSTGRADVQQYRRVFEAYEAEAALTMDEIGDRYLDLYLEMARSHRR